MIVSAVSTHKQFAALKDDQAKHSTCHEPELFSQDCQSNPASLHSTRQLLEDATPEQAHI